jgi:hypothetical protein
MALQTLEQHKQNRLASKKMRVFGNRKLRQQSQSWGEAGFCPRVSGQYRPVRAAQGPSVVLRN